MYYVRKILNSTLFIIWGKYFFPYFVFFCAKVSRSSSKRIYFAFIDKRKSNGRFKYCYFENEKFSTDASLINKFFTEKFLQD